MMKLTIKLKVKTASKWSKGFESWL